jgi:hypothetical protein
MKFYATLLNLKEAKEFSLEEKDIFNPILQASVMDRVLCGCGASEDDALDYAVSNLISENILEVCNCKDSGVRDILAALPAKQALRHLWLEDDEYHGVSKLHALAYHSSLVDICRRYSITDDAQLEVEALFKAVLHKER